jgi:hypothetical protein
MAESTWVRKIHIGKNRRNHCRQICTGETVIDVLSPRPQSSVRANILEVGTSSLKLSVPCFLSPGSLLRIHLTEFVAGAEVRHCTREHSEYHVGVSVVEINPKNPTSVSTGAAEPAPRTPENINS